MQLASKWRKKRTSHGSDAGRGGGAPETGADSGVELATGDALNGPDCGLNLDICDTINSFEWQAKDVVRAIMKRLQHGNPRVQTIALTLLEAMIKNCGDNVHREVAQSNILQELVKIVKKNTEMELRNKILLLLDSWRVAFSGPNGQFPQYYQAYEELKKSGIKFPKRLEGTASTFTPPISHSAWQRHHRTRHGSSNKLSIKHHEAMATEMGNLSLSDLLSIRRVMELLSDMLQASNPNDSMAIKDEVIVDLVHQCRHNQNKIMHLVSSTGDEELLSLGLALNDKLQNLIAKHDAMAYGSPLTELFETVSRGSASSTSGAGSIDQILQEDGDDEDDGFSQLARRNSNLSPVCCQSISSETTGTPDTRREEISSYIPRKPLSLPEFQDPVVVAAKEQEMHGCLSITPVSNISSHHTPLMHSHDFNPDGCEVSGSLRSEALPGPQLYTPQQGCIPYNSYIVPWDQRNLPQPVLQPQPPPCSQSSSHYPPPPWEIDTDDDSGTSTTYEQLTCVPVHHSRSLQQKNPFALSSDGPSASKPLQRRHSFGSTVDNSNISKTLWQQRSFGSTVNGHFASNPFQPYDPFVSTGKCSFASKPLPQQHSSGANKKYLFDAHSPQQNHLSRSRGKNPLVSNPPNQQNSLVLRKDNLNNTAYELLPNTSMSATKFPEAAQNGTTGSPNALDKGDCKE